MATIPTPAPKPPPMSVGPKPDKLPPPGPSNLMVIDASLLPNPKSVKSQ